MSFAMPVSVLHMRLGEIIGSGTGVTYSALTGLEVAGQLGAIVGSMVAVVGLVLGVSAGNAKRRRQYNDDLATAKKAGRDEYAAQHAAQLAEAERERDAAEKRAAEFEARYLNTLEERAGIPPIRRHRSTGGAP